MTDKHSEKQKAQDALIRLCCLTRKQMKWPPVAKVDDLIRKGASFTLKNKTGLMPVEQAAMVGNEAMLTLFMARGGQVNKYASLLYYSALYGHGYLSHLLYRRMSFLGKWRAFKQALMAGRSRQYGHNLRVFCANSNLRQAVERGELSDEKAFQMRPPALFATLKDYGRAFFSMTAKVRHHYQALLQAKKEMKRCLSIGSGDTLIPIFLKAVHQRNPQVVDYLYAHGDVFLVSEKAFASVPAKEEARFMNEWVLVTDDVTELRHQRQRKYLHDRAVRHRSWIHRLGRSLKRLLSKPLYTQTETIRIKKVNLADVQASRPVFQDPPRTPAHPLTEQQILKAALDQTRSLKN